MNVKNTHMHNHVRDLHEFHNSIFNRKDNKGYHPYNSLSDLTQGDRYTAIAAFIEDIPADESIEDYLDIEQGDLIKKCMAGVCNRETVYDALWSSSTTRDYIESIYSDAVNDVYPELVKIYSRTSSSTIDAVSWFNELVCADNKARSLNFNGGI